MDIEKAKLAIQKVIDEIYKEPKLLEDKKDKAYFEIFVEAFETVLNELDKDNNIISDLQNEVTLKQCELDKKDKIINEMAIDLEYINAEILDEYDKIPYAESKQKIIDYFTKKVEGE